MPNEIEQAIKKLLDYNQSGYLPFGDMMPFWDIIDARNKYYTTDEMKDCFGRETTNPNPNYRPPGVNIRVSTDGEMTPAEAAVTINLLISDCHPYNVDKLRAQRALLVARKHLSHIVPTKPNSKRNWCGAWSYFCPSCGLPVQKHEDVNYCGTCGKRLDWRGLIS